MAAKKVVIIGAGIGGLGVANLLAKAGFEVSVYEQHTGPGGRAGRLKIDGFTFDTGPSWYLMPSVFEHYYDLLGEDINEWLQLQKLGPAYKAFFEDRSSLVITSDLEKDAASFENVEAGAGQALKRYVKASQDVYQLSLKHFLYSNFERPTDFLKLDILTKAVRLPRLLIQPIDSYVSGFVSSQKLKQILEYPMVFLGSSPFSAPSMYSLMSALDFKEGVFYPQGGIYEIIDSLVKIGQNNGVEYHYGQTIKRIVANGKRASGIELEDGQVVSADIVISNADLHFSETQLLEPEHQSYPQSYWDKKEAGPGALLVYLGIKGKVPEFEHHNLLLVDKWSENFDAIYNTKTVPEQASIYISKTSQTDPSVAPAGDENLFILVPLPANLSLDDSQVESMVGNYFSQIKTMTGVDLASRILVKQVFKPGDFKTEFNSWQSSMLGQSHLLRQSAFFRTPNRSRKLNNLYYVGGSTTPGIGLPMCLIGAELVYKRLLGDKNGGPVKQIKIIGDSK